MSGSALIVLTLVLIAVIGAMSAFAFVLGVRSAS
jgi:hypothetical protein